MVVIMAGQAAGHGRIRTEVLIGAAQPLYKRSLDRFNFWDEDRDENRSDR
jgi:hypothetical protein